MPMYEYQCDACSHVFDVLAKRKDPPPESCEDCGRGPVRKLVSAPPAILKGAGFYETEYGRSKHNHPEHGKSKDSGGSAGSKTSTEGSSKTESKGSSDGAATKKADPKPSKASSGKAA